MDQFTIIAETEKSALLQKPTFPATVTIKSGTGSLTSMCNNESDYRVLVRRAIAFGKPIK